MFSFSLPTEWAVEIDPTLQEAAEQRSSSQIYCRQDAYLNDICLAAFLSWFQTEYDPEARAWLSPQEQRGIGGILNGCAINLGLSSQRLVLLPSQTSDTEALEIPQEWIDIPSWVADYYLAVQIDPQGEWLRVWAYTTHAEIKAMAVYDGSDRTYSTTTLHRDLNALWGNLQHCPEATTQGPVTCLESIPAGQAENLISRLGNPELAFPRQAIPFQQWGALLDQPSWRRAIAQQRSGTSTQSSALRLGRWLQAQTDSVMQSEGWQSLENLMGANTSRWATSFRNDADPATVKLAKPLTFSSHGSETSVTLLIQLSSELDERISVLIQLHPAEGESSMPLGIELCLSSPTGNILQSVQAESQDAYIQLNRFRCPAETQFHVQVKFGDAVIVEPVVA